MAEGKILVASDVHGRLHGLRWILQNETEADALFFLGDGLYDLERAIALCTQAGHPPAYPIYRVRGNCDVGWPDPTEGLAPVCGRLIFYTHGHLYGVKMGVDMLGEAAGIKGADLALFGHTHAPTMQAPRIGQPTLFNPGSVRDTGSYGVVQIENGNFVCGWKRVPE
ncbi:MAG: metallophosphoesterase family protein [Gemmiger sp.]|nr:metallophosphoesterase family protein [Gemmiger sp.]